MPSNLPARRMSAFGKKRISAGDNRGAICVDLVFFAFQSGSGHHRHRPIDAFGATSCQPISEPQRVACPGDKGDD